MNPPAVLEPTDVTVVVDWGAAKPGPEKDLLGFWPIRELIELLEEVVEGLRLSLLLMAN
jgi:hypothetical protein